MIYSYTQISQYLSCPRRYRHRYLDGWQEKNTRAAMLFGRAFEQGLAAYFRREDPAVTFYREWEPTRSSRYIIQDAIAGMACCSKASSYLSVFARKIGFAFASSGRINRLSSCAHSRVATNSSRTWTRGNLDNRGCLLEWKTSSCRYPEQPEGLLALDPQLVCYSWITGISDVAQVVFVRKRLVEIQYFRTSITDEQRRDFSHLVQQTMGRSSQRSFCRTVAFVFRRISAAAAPM